jgi:hypothetical protein
LQYKQNNYVMAFSDYKTLEAIQAKYPQIVVKNEEFLPHKLPLTRVKPSLKEEIELNLKTYRSNEFYATETLVSPILRTVWRKYMEEVNMWTHQSIKYNDDLSGVPDFMFTHLKDEQYEVMSYPIITSVEAKAENFVEGWSQCIVQMLACQKINIKPNIIIFGIVTTGKQWEFGKFEGNIVTKNTTGCGIDNLPKLMSILDYLLSEAKKQL